LLAAALGACAQGKVSAPPAEEQAGVPAPGGEAPVVSAPAVPVPPPDSSVEVGLLLPLSGSNAALGQALLNAAGMAMFDQGDERFTLVVRDAAMPGGAAQAAQQLAQEGVRIVLGPIFASTVSQA